MISPTDLNYFVEISQTLSLSRAAVRLGVSQPSLTVAIQRLEHELGVPVFTRSKKGVVLTKAGKNLLKYTNGMLMQWNGIKNSVNEEMLEISGKVVIGCHSAIGMYCFEHFLPKLVHDNLKLHIELQHNISKIITDMVINREIDIGLSVNPVPHRDLVSIKLLDDRFSIWCTKKMREKDRVFIGDMDIPQTQIIINMLGKKGIVYDRFINCNNLDNIAFLTKLGVGYGLLPERVARRYCPNTIIQMAGAPVHIDELKLIYHVENKQVRSIRFVVDSIRKSMDI